MRFCETKPIVMLRKLHLYCLWRTSWIDCRKMTNGFVFSSRGEKFTECRLSGTVAALTARGYNRKREPALRGWGPRLTTAATVDPRSAPAATTDSGRRVAIPRRSFDRLRMTD